MKPTNVTLFTMTLYNSENSICDQWRSQPKFFWGVHGPFGPPPGYAYICDIRPFYSIARYRRKLATSKRSGFARF